MSEVIKLITSINKGRVLLVILGLAFIVAVSFYGSEFQLQQWAQWLVFCALSVSLVWVWGHAGIFSFAQVAFFGIGAYVYGVAGINLFPITNETLSAVFIASLFTIVFAAFLGYFLFYGKISDVFIAISTLAVSLVLNTLMTGTADTKYTIGNAHLGGFNGMGGIPPLTLGIPGTEINEMLFGKGFFLFIGFFSILVAYIVSLVRDSSFGKLVGAVRENEYRAELLGINVPKVKVLAFTFSAGIAGAAGAFFAAWGNFIDPTVFGLQMATLLMVWVFSGGRTSLIGAFVGVFAIQKVSEEITTTGTTITPLFLGCILIAIIIVIPNGIIPALGSLLKRKARGSDANSVREEGFSLSEPPKTVFADNGAKLEVEKIKKYFGGVGAVKGVDLNFEKRGVYCLIGPNGAGKSTFFNLIVGIHEATSGSIKLDGKEIVDKDIVWRIQHGMSIKPQVLSLFPKLSLFENLWIAAYARSHDKQSADEVATELLDWLGYASEERWTPVENIAHGNQQWIDIAMALAQKPNLLLLDEPVAGMGKEESARVAELVRRLGENITVLLVEHDMEFVRQLQANEVVVFHQGEVLSAGSLDDIQSNERVLEVYLGRG